MAIFLFWCANNSELEGEKQKIADEKIALENERKQLEEEKKKMEEQKNEQKNADTEEKKQEEKEAQKKKPFVAKNTDELVKNAEFRKGKIWWYTRQKNEITDKDAYGAFLVSTKKDVDSLGNNISPMIMLINHNNSNTITLRTWSDLTPRYDGNTDGWYVDIPIRIFPFEVETYTFHYDLFTKKAVMQEKYVEKFLQNLRKSEKMIMVLDFEYGWDGNYEFLTAGMEF